MNKGDLQFRETPQRKKILNVLCSTSSHPTADWIYAEVKKEFPRLSLGTVYRNLRILRDQGRVLELPFGDTFDRFDGRVTPHSHFVCKKCHQIHDVEEEFPPLPSSTTKGMNRVEEVRITYYGVCSDCQTH